MMRYYVCLHRQEKRYWKNRKAYKKSRHQRPIRRAINKNYDKCPYYKEDNKE